MAVEHDVRLVLVGVDVQRRLGAGLHGDLDERERAAGLLAAGCTRTGCRDTGRPGEPDRSALGISAAGVWLTDDHGASWRRGNAGLIARYTPEELQAETDDLCVHAMRETKRLRRLATGRLARSMSLPPDRPTEPLRPAPAPAPRQPVAYEPAPAPAVDVTAVLVRLEDAVNSVRTGLMIVGVIAVAALGVAIYALVREGDTSSGAGGASSARVSGWTIASTA